jgi:dipeptidyl aminopeptidase/acylaminoacyl peptidase
MKKISLIMILICLFLQTFAQTNKRELTYDDILKWNRITEKEISNDGNYIVYKSEPWKGNAVLKVSNISGEEIASYNCGTSAEITENSNFVIFKIVPSVSLVRELELKKTKKEDMPLNQLAILDLRKNIVDTIPNLISHKVPKKWNNWIAYQSKSIVVKDTTEEVNKKNLKEESKENGYLLNIKNLVEEEFVSFPFVTDYLLSKEEQVVVFVSTGDQKEFKPGIYFYDLKSKIKTEVINGKGNYKQLSLNKTSEMLAFLADTTNNKKTDFSFFLWKKKDGLSELINSNSNKLSSDFELSENGMIEFSENSERIFFGIAQKKLEKDTTVLDKEIPKLDVWHWNESVLHSEQIYKKNDDLKSTIPSVYHLNKKYFVQLGSDDFTGIEFINNGNADKLVAWSNLPYSVQTMWEGYPEHHDFYLIDIYTGKAKLIKKDCRATPRVSPKGKYLYWYNAMDTTWNTFRISTEQEYKITHKEEIQCADEINDVPNPADEYGIAGWIEDDKALLIYDRYDIWKVDPENKKEAKNLTVNGKNNKVNYRLIDFENYNRRKFDEDPIGINSSKTAYLKGHNEIDRTDSYYSFNLKEDNLPEKLNEGNFRLSTPLKAAYKNVFVFTKESFEIFPNLHLTLNNFKDSKTISNVNSQQDEFLWGTKELYTWTSLDGKKLEGILIKPANFDPNKKYPMIVNFYEKSSQQLYYHQTPEAHRSTIDYHYYSSNGYLIFNPDVYYKTGYPGEDAFNCVMPGITQLISEGFVDKDNIAAQGHSWGGYQVAYLATRTNLFAAIESGAPVVNMFSAYGGIRLWSGKNRSFQYEHTQSRIGKSIWESPLRYIENSPLFTADKIQTPILIMHNENDGAVPFGQGIEFFIALRRLGKVSWLLNYNEADHWPTKVRDKYDFQIRLAQFFDHYLKDKPMPVWMKEGVPAVSKGLGMGLEIN